MMDQNYCEAINNCAASDNVYKFMSTVKDTPAYWQHIISDVLVMVKQLGIHTYFMTLSCADFHWNELVLIIRKLKERTGDSDISGLDYDSQCIEKVILFYLLGIFIAI